MILFIVSFIIFTFTNTFFHNFQISILVIIFCLILCAIFLIFKYKKNIKKYSKYILILLGSFVVALFAITIKDWRYDGEVLHDFVEINKLFINSPLFHTITPLSLIVQDKPNENNGYYIGSGKIIDTYSYGKYILQDDKGDKYILNTDKDYQIGDQLRLVGYSKKVEFNKIWNYSGIWDWKFDYNKWLIMKGYKGNLYEGNSILLKEGNFSASIEMTISSGLLSNSKEIGFVQNIKRSLQSRIISTYGENRNAGLILGMLIGDKSQIPKSDYKTFVNSGLVHIIAVSGGNIIMLIVFFSFILFFLPFYLRNFIILLIIVLYAFICGMDSSVLRAILFSGLAMMALFVGRESNFWRSVGCVFVVMLLINPYFLLYDLGFLLSFGAVIGIKIFTKKRQTEKKQLDPGCKKTRPEGLKLILNKMYNDYIKPSIGANIGIFPIIIFFMGQINIVGFISNLFILPIVPFVMIYGFISIFLYQLFPREGICIIENILIKYIYKVSELGSDYGIYLLVQDYKIKYLILISFVIGLIIYLYKNKLILIKNNTTTKLKNKL